MPTVFFRADLIEDNEEITAHVYNAHIPESHDCKSKFVQSDVAAFEFLK